MDPVVVRPAVPAARPLFPPLAVNMDSTLPAWVSLPLVHPTRSGSDQDATLLVLPHHYVQLGRYMEPRARGRGARTVCRAGLHRDV